MQRPEESGRGGQFHQRIGGEHRRRRRPGRLFRREVLAAGKHRSGPVTARAVYLVAITGAGGGQEWESRYGLPVANHSHRAAVDAALDELLAAWRDPAAWRGAVVEGMSEREAEAILESPALGRDAGAAAWIGPELEALEAAHRTAGSWMALATPP